MQVVFEGSGACSAVMRDDQGRFFGGYTLKCDGIVDSFLLEVMAIRQALSWVKARNKSQFIVELDCLFAVQLVNTNYYGQSTVDRIIMDCRCLLSTLHCV